MGQQAEGAPRGFHRIRGVAHWVSNYLNSTDGAPVSPGLGQQEAVQPPLVQRAPQQAVRRQIGSIEPAQVPSTREARRQAARIAYLTREPEGSEGSKRKHHIKQRVAPTVQAIQPEQSEQVPVGYSIITTPRFRDDFDNLKKDNAGREEVKGALRAIQEGNGFCHAYFGVKGQKGLYTAHEHAGRGDDRRIILKKISPFVYQAIAILPPGHDYGKEAWSIRETMKFIPAWEDEGEMVPLEEWLGPLI